MGNSGQPDLFSGTSGLILPVKNKQFYPVEFKDKPRLTYYASLFNSIEINSTFYKIPMESTIRNWSEQVPENFRFTFKLWKGITHRKGLAFESDDVFRFIRTINNIGLKKGCLLVQFPPGFKIDLAQRLEVLLTKIKEADPENSWKTAIEFRHKSWYHEGIFDLLEEHKVGVVVHDKPGSETPYLESSVNFKYLRFHGPDGDYRGHYTNDFLHEYASYIHDWTTMEEKEVYVYFNNTMGDAVKNLAELNSLVTAT